MSLGHWQFRLRTRTSSSSGELHRQLVEAAEGDAGTRAAELDRLRDALRQAAELVRETGLNAPAGELAKEVQELFHYIQQRIRFGFGEFYNYAFNPSSLQDDGRDLRRAVWTSWLELRAHAAA